MCEAICITLRRHPASTTRPDVRLPNVQMALLMLSQNNLRIAITAMHYIAEGRVREWSGQASGLQMFAGQDIRLAQ